jgi:hypothetical protein
MDLRKIFGPSREEEIGRGGKFYKKGPIGLFSHKMLFKRSDKGECHWQVCDTYRRKKDMHTQICGEA